MSKPVVLISGGLTGIGRSPTPPHVDLIETAAPGEIDECFRNRGRLS
jgi:hypothetical protein